MLEAQGRTGFGMSSSASWSFWAKLCPMDFDRPRGPRLLNGGGGARRLWFESSEATFSNFSAAFRTLCRENSDSEISSESRLGPGSEDLLIGRTSAINRVGV